MHSGDLNDTPKTLLDLPSEIFGHIAPHLSATELATLLHIENKRLNQIMMSNAVRDVFIDRELPDRQHLMSEEAGDYVGYRGYGWQKIARKIEPILLLKDYGVDHPFLNRLDTVWNNVSALPLEERGPELAALYQVYNDALKNLVRVRGSGRLSPFEIAIEKGLPRTIEALVNAGAQTNKKHLLVDKVETQNVYVVAALTHCAGIDVNATNTEGLTPLIVAIQKKDEPMVRALLGFKKIDVNFVCRVAGTTMTALSEAVDERHCGILRLLIQDKRLVLKYSEISIMLRTVLSQQPCDVVTILAQCDQIKQALPRLARELVRANDLGLLQTLFAHTSLPMNVRDDTGQTLVALAEECRHVHIVDWFLRNNIGEKEQGLPSTDEAIMLRACAAKVLEQLPEALPSEMESDSRFGHCGFFIIFSFCGLSESHELSPDSADVYLRGIRSDLMAIMNAEHTDAAAWFACYETLNLRTTALKNHCAAMPAGTNVNMETSEACHQLITGLSMTSVLLKKMGTAIGVHSKQRGLYNV